jgi:hypothetical protein
MKEFDEVRFNRLEERAWQSTLELEARGKADADDTEAAEKPSELNKKAGENHGRPV